MKLLGFQWNEAKNQANILKHGIDFRDAILIFNGPTLDRIDDRAAYGEQRVNSIGEIAEVVIVNVTHTDRNGEIRIISARRADRAERRLYEAFKRRRVRSSRR